MPVSSQQLAEYHATAMMEHLLPRSVALILHTPEDRPKSIGSGTCVKIGQRHFVATCAHVLHDVELRDVGVLPLAKSAPMDNRTPRLARMNYRGGRDDDPVDVGWLEITPDAVPWVERQFGRLFVTLDRFGVAPVAPLSHASLLGVPCEYLDPIETTDGKLSIMLQAFPFTTHTIPPPSARPMRDLYLDYQDVMFSPDGMRDAPHPHGLSGSGLWVLNEGPDRLWTPDHARLVGIENAWCKADRYLRGNPIRDWLELLRSDLPEVASEIDAVLTAA